MSHPDTSYLPEGLFAQGSGQEWIEAITRELKGFPFEKIKSRTDEDIVLEPFYTQDSESDVPYLKELPWFHFIRSLNPNPLKVRQTLMESDVKLYSESIPDFPFQAGIAEFSATAGMEFLRSLSDMPVDFRVGYSEDAAKWIQSHKLQGTALWQASDISQKDQWPEGFSPIAFRGDLWHNQGANDAQEIAFVLYDLISWLDAWTESGRNISAAVKLINFRFALGPDVFAGLAKIRAFRGLYFQLMKAYGIQSPEQPLILTESSLRYYSALDPHNNLLRAGSAALISICAGVYSFEAWPFDPNEARSFSLRMSRNIRHILNLESYTDKTADPFGGSWWLESYTWKLMQSAEKIRTELEQQGLHTNPEVENLRQALLSENKSRLQKNFNTGKTTLTGVNRYTPKQFHLHGTFHIPGTDGEVFRIALDFEKMIAQGSGLPGYAFEFVSTEKDCQARADFIRQFMSSCGLKEVPASAEVTLRVICGTDADYASESVQQKIKSWASEYFLALAGKPENADLLIQEKGIKICIQLHSDRIQTASVLHSAYVVS